MTMVDTLYDAHYRSREKLAWAFAEILNDEARAIEAAGVDVIQFDEPAFNVYFDEVRDWGVRTLERAAQGLRCTTAVHICYGYGIKANIEWKKTLGSGMAAIRADVSAARAARRSARSRSSARTRTSRSSSIGLLAGQGRARRGDRRRDRAHRDAGGGRRDDSLRAPVRSRRAPLPLHELRDGAARPGGRPRQAPRARARAPRWSGPRSPSRDQAADRPRRRPSAAGRRTPKRRPCRPLKIPLAPAGLVVYPAATCFSFKAVSTPCTTALQSFHRRSFLEIETWPGSVPISILFVRNY